MMIATMPAGHACVMPAMMHTAPTYSRRTKNGQRSVAITAANVLEARCEALRAWDQPLSARDDLPFQ